MRESLGTRWHCGGCGAPQWQSITAAAADMKLRARMFIVADERQNAFRSPPAKPGKANVKS
jgi:hypothetical protein